MKTVKQVLMTERELSLESDAQILESLVHLGLLEQGRANLVKRAMYTNTAAMTMAEKQKVGILKAVAAAKLAGVAVFDATAADNNLGVTKLNYENLKVECGA